MTGRVGRPAPTQLALLDKTLRRLVPSAIREGREGVSMKIPGRPDNVGESRAKVAVHPEWQSLQLKMDLWPVIAGDSLSCSWKLDSSNLFHAEPIYQHQYL